MTILFLIKINSLLAYEDFDSFAEVECRHTKTSFKCVQFLNNYDGDTVTFNIPGVHPLLGEEIPVRVLGIDAPEIKSKDKCEKEKALMAKALVKDILSKARKLELLDIGREKYFRIVARIMADGKSIGETLLKEGLAYPYFGETKKEINWCLDLVKE